MTHRRNKVVNAATAVQHIKDGAWIAIQGSGGGVGEPTAVLRALRNRFLSQQHPRDLTLYHSSGIGDQAGSGTDLLALDGLVTCDIGGHLAMAPRMAAMIMDNRVKCYNFPQGVLTHLYDAIAAKTPGVFSKVGLGTYIDPRLDGGRMNVITTEDRVRVVEFDGEEWLFFPRVNLDVGFIRGTTADEDANITCEQEPVYLDSLALAQAVKACGGIVIAQVKYLAERGSLHPQQVRIPGILVDYVVADADQQQTCEDDYQPGYCGNVRVPSLALPELPLDARKVIARRATAFLEFGQVVNLGVGMPSGVAPVAVEQGLIEHLTFTVEHGAIGGIPAGGVVFGVAYNPTAIVTQSDQFRFYDGGGIDLAFLGMAQLDRHGNVNVSKVGGMLAGCGGFINISQNAKAVVFCGAFSAKGMQCTLGDGQLNITRPGHIRKLVGDVDQITFSGTYALKTQKPVHYITERAVFTLTQEGVLLTEIAPGIDLRADVLDQMDFTPRISGDLKTMDHAYFRE